MLIINKIYCENCLDTMARLPDKSIDLTVTSPPYDNMRVYEGYSFDFESVAKELYRTTKDGGVIVWVVNDGTYKGSESGTSFKQALFFKDLGFSLETMIWEKAGNGCLGSNRFYAQNFEYMFVLTKGRPKTINFICDRENKIKEGYKSVNSGLDKTGRGKTRQIKLKPYGKRTNIWRITPQRRLNNHPAPYPEQLAKDHITSWSNVGDLIYDPFMGSGTTAKVARSLGRNFIGSELSSEYCKIAEARLQEPR